MASVGDSFWTFHPSVEEVDGVGLASSGSTVPWYADCNREIGRMLAENVAAATGVVELGAQVVHAHTPVKGPTDDREGAAPTDRSDGRDGGSRLRRPFRGPRVSRSGCHGASASATVPQLPRDVAGGLDGGRPCRWTRIVLSGLERCPEANLRFEQPLGPKSLGSVSPVGAASLIHIPDHAARWRSGAAQGPALQTRG